MIILKEEKILDYDKIKDQLLELANSSGAKEKIRELRPYRSEAELTRHLRETSQARKFLDLIGLPPLPAMEQLEQIMIKLERYELLLPEELEVISLFLTAVVRMREYLKRGEIHQFSLAYYHQELVSLEEVQREIDRCIRSGRIDDFASTELKNLRRDLQLVQEKIRSKAEHIMKSMKSAMSESFVVQRSGKLCLPVKKEYRSKIEGSVIDQSSSGSTLFIEPKAVAALQAEYDQLKLEEDNEERKILYTLMSLVEDHIEVIKKNRDVLIKLDFVFAKGKLSAAMDGVPPEITTDQTMRIKGARHPLLPADSCVPLDFVFEKGCRGVVITGPNTGGKTVSIKTVGLFTIMAGSGLHLPCTEAKICMVNQVLCDIGDGQDIKDNLSTFSAHIKTILEILKKVTKESLVILDELGSGTDPAEGMGIAIAILEALKNSGCLFLVTTHYPEVKSYADRYTEIVNARMAFDRENLKPLYRMEIGRAGDSCALYIAKKLGMPSEMLMQAAKEAYGDVDRDMTEKLGLNEKQERNQELKKIYVPGIEKRTEVKQNHKVEQSFSRGDSVTVLPEGIIGIVVTPPNEKGNVLVQIKKEKKEINYKRLKLKVAADQLYPSDYDFSIIFDTVKERKAHHQMDKKHCPDLIISKQG